MTEFVPKLKKSYTKVFINGEERIVHVDVANMILECREFRRISEGRSPKQLIEYINDLHKKYYQLLMNEKNK